jgi:putative FmdB family regulatory protein
MPFYDYKCDKCEHIFEEMLKVADRKKPERKKCPGCGASGGVKQHISGGVGVAIDKNMRVDGNATGGFRDAMQKIIESPGIKHSRRADYYKTRWGL